MYNDLTLGGTDVTNDLSDGFCEEGDKTDKNVVNSTTAPSKGRNSRLGIFWKQLVGHLESRR